jgi:general secretion pathway protein N
MTFIVSLIATAPAQLVSAYLPPNIQASGLEGTLWQGHARRLQVQGFNLGKVGWTVRPLALLMGRLQSDVTISQADLHGHVKVGRGFNSIRLSDMHVEARAQLFTRLVSSYGINIDGRVKADAPIMQFDDRGPQAMDGVIVWHDARLASPAKVRLGDVNVTLEQTGDFAIANLSNTADALRVTGKAHLEPGWKYQATLRVQPTPSTPQEIRNVLPYLGRPDSRGTVTLNWQGTLNPGGML